MRRFRQGKAPVILYSQRGVKLFDFGMNRIIETDDDDLINLLLAMGAVEIPAATPAVPQDLSEVAARINALDGRVVVVEGRADIRSVGDGLSLSGAGELSATGSGSGGVSDSVDWANVTNKPDNLATTDDIDAKVFVATYNVTTAQEIIAHLDGAAEPFAPVLVKRGADYYTVVTAAKQAENKVIIRTFATLSGDFYMFTYTVTGASWSASSHGFQKLLESGTSIKTVNGETLLGSGNIDIQGGSGGDAVLTAALTASKTVGGITSGKEYAASTSLESLFRDMLNPVEVPAFTPPSATIAASGGLLVEEGTTASKTLTVSFSRGSINPKYGTSGYRSGAATGYSLNGGASQSGNTFTVTVDDGNKSFTATVDYAAGEQPKNSAGENYGEPLAPGSVNTNTLTFEIVAALWSNAANIAQIAKETLISKGAKQKQFNFPAQTAANPEVFDVPASWNVTAVELLNTLNNQWANCLSEFNVTDETHGAIAYKRYTYNGGGATGARSVRIKWS